MRIALITNYFPPEIGAAAHLYLDLARGLASRGHFVQVLTGTPRYNIEDHQGSIERAKEFDAKEPYEVLRVKLQATPRDSPMRRGLEQFSIAWRFATSNLLLQYDVAIVYSPPLTLGLTGIFLNKKTKSPFILNVQDLFPQSAIDLGVLRSGLIIKAFESIERYIYRKTGMITVHSQGNADHVISKGIPPSKVRTLPNWVNTDEITPGDRENDFRRSLGYRDDQFLVSFAGTLGFSQDLDVVIDAARKLNSSDIRFLIVGDGVEKERLVTRVEKEKIRNIDFLPMQPKEKYPEVLAASDASLVTLKPDVLTPVVPSKMLSIMAARRVVVAALPMQGDAPKIISDSRCGVCVPAGDSEQLAVEIERLKDSPERLLDLATNGRKFVVENYSIDACINMYEKLFETMRSSGSQSITG